MVFDQIMAMTKGGPEQSTESISYLIYNNGPLGRKLRLPERQRGCILHRDRGDLRSADDDIK